MFWYFSVCSYFHASHLIERRAWKYKRMEVFKLRTLAKSFHCFPASRIERLSICNLNPTYESMQSSEDIELPNGVSCSHAYLDRFGFRWQFIIFCDENRASGCLHRTMHLYSDAILIFPFTRQRVRRWMDDWNRNETQLMIGMLIFFRTMTVHAPIELNEVEVTITFDIRENTLRVST